MERNLSNFAGFIVADMQNSRKCAKINARLKASLNSCKKTSKSSLIFMDILDFSLTT